jgi:hypothetical protein
MIASGGGRLDIGDLTPGQSQIRKMGFTHPEYPTAAQIRRWLTGISPCAKQYGPR